MKFLRGYGQGRPVPSFALQGEAPPGLKQWYRASLRWLFPALGGSAALALLLPAGMASQGSAVRTLVDLAATVYPYITWAEKRSSMPDVVAVWYTITVPVFIAIFSGRMLVYPYRDLARLARTSMGSIKQHLLLIAAAWLLLWVGIDTLVLPSERTSALPELGHGQALLYASLNSRVGLAALGSLFHLLFLFTVFTATAVTVGFVLRLTSIGDNRDHSEQHTTEG